MTDHERRAVAPQSPALHREDGVPREGGTMTDNNHCFRRRFFLKHSAGVAAASMLPVTRTASANIPPPSARDLSMVHTHTRERIALVYAVEQSYVPDALATLNRFLRDHYSGDIGRIDPRLFDLLHQVRALVGGTQPFEVISGYRNPATNETLRTTRAGGVARHSLHMEGRAIDVRLPGVPLADVRDAAVSLKAGGVGYYAGQFVHVDTGRVRRW
jgi:uncharacterized protein YcbK (DUF882 family)